jgi:hypothetical protein
MLDQLYVARGCSTFGPFSAAQLRGLAAAGRIRSSDTVWREGEMGRGVLAAKVKNLFPSAQADGAGSGAGDGCAPTPLSPPNLAPVVPSESPPIPFNAPAQPDESEPPAAAVQPDSAPLDSLPRDGVLDPTPSSGVVPQEKAPRPPAEPARKWRAVARNGAIILSQDGATVRYRKKCSQCGFEDRCRSSMHIDPGVRRIRFYCPKCRKSREIQIQGIMQ